MPNILISDPVRLGEAVANARASGTCGLDTEFMREKTYRARLCLVQIATPDEICLIDPTAGLDLAPVAELVSDDDVEIVVHAGRQDLEILNERYGIVPANVFDVQIAAGFVGLGASLPYGRLVTELTGTKLEKGESYTDWCKRPLSGAQLSYAADDVRYLITAAQKLEARLEEVGRATWAREEMRGLCDPSAYDFDPGRAWRRVSGRGSLSARQTAVLKEVACWREETAVRRDIPRGWVVKDVTLVEIARRSPAGPAALKGVRGMNAKEVERAGGQILKAVELGRSAAPIESARTASRTTLARARMLSSLADAVVRARCENAGIANEVITTRSELEALLVQVIDGSLDEDSHRLLRGWRRGLAGEAVLALARGRVALRATSRAPYIEEVPLQ